VEVVKVLIFADNIALLHFVEHCVAQDSTDEEDKHEQNKNVEQRFD